MVDRLTAQLATYCALLSDFDVLPHAPVPQEARESGLLNPLLEGVGHVLLAPGLLRHTEERLAAKSLRVELVAADPHDPSAALVAFELRSRFIERVGQMGAVEGEIIVGILDLEAQ